MFSTVKKMAAKLLLKMSIYSKTKWCKIMLLRGALFELMLQPHHKPIGC